ncbi:phenylacetic acid degradation bifunctional protein PaaZ, partial [Kocuria sp. UBA5001]
MSTQTQAPETSAPQILPSFVRGQWWRPDDPQKVTDVKDAATGELVARVSTDGLDTAGAVEYARTVGQASLGQLRIHDRALILKQLAQHLGEHKGQLYELSYATGSTAKDHLIDVDGGIGTLFTFSSKGRRELPNANVIVDGAVEQLSRDGSFLGEHVYTRLPGVAVQINAFNFPVWGMLEKFAPAFIAGVPTIVKPATPTGYVTEACVRLMLDSGLLPEGSLQLVSGSAGDLLDHLDARDHVAFTGSAATARSLRGHTNVAENGVRFTAETDSLNAAVMAPDVTEDSPEFEAFVKSVVLEITAKAGQKCTAIRRVVVPEQVKAAVVTAIRKRVAQRAVVGDPRDAATTVGPLASEDQYLEVLRSVRTLVDAGATVELGGPEELSSVPQHGAFFPVTVLSFDDARTPVVHEVEAFGPVTSVLG